MKLKIVIALLLYCSLASAQLNDLARVDFTILSAGNSNMEYNQVRALINYPKKLKKEGTYHFLG